MKISEIMTPNVTMVSPDATLVVAAEAMRDKDTGALPVGDGEELMGMVTDRDIAVRGVASGKPAERMLVREVMTPQVLYCFDDQEVAEVAGNMGDVQARRMPVVNRDKRLVGIVAVADVARHDADAAKSAEAGVAATG